MRLYWSPDCANLVVRLTLELFEMPYESIRLDRAQGDHKSARYLALNPQGLIPVLEDGNAILFETGAILWHLMERAGRLGPEGPPLDAPVSRAAALRWLFFLSNTLHADLRVAFYTHRYATGADDIARLRRHLKDRVDQHAALIENELNPGFLGAELSVPDIYLAVCLRWAQIYPSGGSLLADLRQWPKLQALATRLEMHPAALRAFAAEQIPPDGALTCPKLPNLPLKDVLG